MNHIESFIVEVGCNLFNKFVVIAAIYYSGNADNCEVGE